MSGILYRNRFILKNIAKLFLTPLSSLVRKDKNLILFHGSDLHRFSENGRYLFLHLHHEGTFRVIWITSCKTLQRELTRLGYRSEIHASIRGVLLYLRAGCVIGSGSRYPDFAGAVGRKTVKLCLHHGSGPRTTNGMSDGGQRKFIKYVNEWDYFNFTSRWMSAAVGKLQFLLPYEKRVILGYPRCDHLINPCLNKGGISHRSLPLNYDPRTKSKIILLAATWREHKDISWNTLANLSGYDEAHLDAFLEDEDLLLYISLHPRTNIESGVKLKSSRIRIIEEGLLFDINEFLPYVAVLITDYSSIATDFLLTGRPVVYYWPDYEFYIDHVGLLEPIRSLNPGTVVDSFSQLLDALKGCSDMQLVDFRKRLDLYLEKYYDRSLGNACGRILEFLKGTL